MHSIQILIIIINKLIKMSTKHALEIPCWKKETSLTWIIFVLLLLGEIFLSNLSAGIPSLNKEQK